jgi:hypothetical protein
MTNVGRARMLLPLSSFSCIVGLALGRPAAAGRIPHSYSVASGPTSTEIDLPLDSNEGLCLLSGLSGPGRVHVGIAVTGLTKQTASARAFPGQVETTATATCYPWSDFANLPAHDLIRFWASIRETPEPISRDPAVGVLCTISQVEGEDAASDFFDLQFDFEGESWAISVHNASTMGECRQLGASLPYTHVLVAAPGGGGSDRPQPRADESFCMLTSAIGTGTVDLHVNASRRWQLDIGGGVLWAKALCFSLDFSPGCHSLSDLGDTHVCPTNISGFVETFDPYCTSNYWDQICVDEATCADSICELDPYCCEESWDWICEDEYNASC